MNARVARKGLELMSSNDGWFEIKQQLSDGEAALVADS